MRNWKRLVKSSSSPLFTIHLVYKFKLPTPFNSFLEIEFLKIRKEKYLTSERIIQRARFLCPGKIERNLSSFRPNFAREKKNGTVRLDRYDRTWTFEAERRSGCQPLYVGHFAASRSSHPPKSPELSSERQTSPPSHPRWNSGSKWPSGLGNLTSNYRSKDSRDVIRLAEGTEGMGQISLSLSLSLRIRFEIGSGKFDCQRFDQPQEISSLETR